MTPSTFDAFKLHAGFHAPFEACGLIVRRADDRQERYIPCRNIAEAEDEFTIDPEDWASAEDLGEVLAVCHSHPGSPRTPSQWDRLSCDLTALPWFILGADGLHRMDPEGYALEGRVFAFGWADCWTLIRDWANESWPDFPREWRDVEGLLEAHMNEVGWTQIQGEFQAGDVLLMKIKGSSTNHCAAYLGAGEILHHRVGLLSGRDQLGPYLNAITHVFRRPE